MTSFEIRLPIGYPLLSANGREHWRKRANITAAIRACARGQCWNVRPIAGRVKIRAVYHAPDNRRRDVSNLFPSVKAGVDGIVDAGIIKDDSDRYVVSLEMVRSPDNIKLGQLVIQVIEVDDDCY